MLSMFHEINNFILNSALSKLVGYIRKKSGRKWK